MISIRSLLLATLLLSAAPSLAAPIKVSAAPSVVDVLPRSVVDATPELRVRIVDMPVFPRGKRSRTFRRSRLATEEPGAPRSVVEARDTPAELPSPPPPSIPASPSIRVLRRTQRKSSA
ncbi:hypothetical protein C0993_003270 [Termitomyces sp. T159_Od127]|nr:hypothetical protein C0993_003270 [Termitomyces sp. T159_Od127]